MVKEDVVKEGEIKGEKVKRMVKEVMKEWRIIGEVRGKGVVVGIEFVGDEKRKKRFGC